jgi:beta-lactam-binding protein with PASTA domain
VTATNDAGSTAQPSAPYAVRPPVAVLKCVVPKLKGKTLKQAKAALKKAHCKLGKVKGSKSKHAKVKKQSRKAKTVLAAGSKINLTMKK